MGLSWRGGLGQAAPTIGAAGRVAAGMPSSSRRLRWPRRPPLSTVTLLALLVRAILERACRQSGQPLTAERLFRGFARLQAVDLTWADGSLKRRASEMTAFQRETLDALGWPLADAYANEPLLKR